MELEEIQGIASIALLPSGSISGHFVHPPSSSCLGLYGTEIPCARECSRAEDYRLINLTLLDYRTKKETSVIVECRGQDASRFHNVDDVHGWEEDVIKAAKASDPNNHLQISFECETLKADEDAERHLQRFLPALANKGAVVNIGTMKIKGLDLEELTRSSNQDAVTGKASLQPNTPESIDPEFTLHDQVVEVKTMEQLQLDPSPQDMTDEIGKLLEEELQAEGLADAPVEFSFSWKDQLNPRIKVPKEEEDLDEEMPEESLASNTS
ncbi:uncharacterized protein LOC9637113 [Selaginella moellendorffii]|uniref:uncharacterized protein LOC9637113 n=1 Tax=Selaginella moellendorffii TaxID=88036 RepID=UPI000D1CBBEE|nr:uncharacterized protein LOC9637113 [Selaginella moellendorffii]|eukprot:XP_002988475.2 uncharacterized protein LOC9637113 [Selaginella moellendorffii]